MPSPIASVLNRQRSGRGLAVVAVVVAVTMGGILLASAVGDIPIRLLLGDPAAITEAPFYLGAVTLLRTGLLAGAAAVCLVTAGIVRGRDHELGEFLLALGLFSAALVLDDQFQGHEVVLESIVGIPQPVTFAVVAMIAVAGALRYGRIARRQPDAALLVLMFPLIGYAVIADSLDGPLFSPLPETTAELAGIACLAVFGVRTSVAALRAAVHHDG